MDTPSVSALEAGLADAKAEAAALRAGEQRYRALFDSIDEGFCVVEMLFDADGRPADYRFLELNPAFVRQTGLHGAVGRTMREIAPEHEEHWFEIYGRIAMTGEPERFEQRADALGRWYDVYAFRVDAPAQRHVAILFRDVLERRRAEEVVRTSEERLRALVGAGAASIYRMSPDWRLMYQLDSRDFLATTAEPIADWEERYILAEDRQMVAVAIAEAIRTRSVFKLEHRVALADGGVGWVMSRAVPIFDARGVLVEWFGSGVDVTARKRIEEALRESEARLAAAFESVPVGVAVIGVSGTAILANTQYRRFLPSGIIPSRDPERLARWRAWDPQGRPLEPCDFPGGRALRGESVLPGQEMLYRDDDGREIWTSVASAPTRDEHGNVVGAVAVISDIDAARRGADALRESEERLRQFGDASQDVLWIRDAETLQWTYLTPAFETIYGLSREEALSGDDYRSWLDLIVPEDREGAMASIERVRAGEQVAFEFRIRRPRDGTIRWMRNTDFPLPDAAGQVTRIGGIGSDITELREATERQEVLVAELQHRVRNILAVVRSVFGRTVEAGGDVEDVSNHFRGRLDALARTQVVVTQNARGAADLENLIRDELVSVGVSDGPRLTLEGPDIALPSKIAETIGLAIHELTTNALKYGALSAPNGKLDIRWSLNIGYRGKRALLLTWLEQGVPAVSLDPLRRGFGTELIVEALPYRLGAETKLEFLGGGVRCSITVPLPDEAQSAA